MVLVLRSPILLTLMLLLLVLPNELLVVTRSYEYAIITATIVAETCNNRSVTMISTF